MWFLPILIVGATFALSIPFGYYLAWIIDGRYRAPRWLGWIEQRLDTGPQNWKQYAFAMLLFNTVMFVVGFRLLAVQPLFPLNPDGKKMLAPTTIFNTVCSFLTNTNLQHYSGDSIFRTFQLVVLIWNSSSRPALASAALAGDHPRLARRFRTWATYYLDLWGVIAYSCRSA